ncbi:hypothetical protein C8Q80DRAFT_646262 [Daedaleopsis nitida]|nr:hypothetical protein C8Q80DRAFT_646262 [Daedaleopsis nitida]
MVKATLAFPTIHKGHPQPHPPFLSSHHNHRSILHIPPQLHRPDPLCILTTCHRTAMAALLHAILTDGYTPGLLRAAMSGTLALELEDRKSRTKVVQPLCIVAPRPKKSPKCFENIIYWEEEKKEEADSPREISRSATEPSSPLHGDSHVSRVLEGSHPRNDATPADYPFAKWPPSTDFFRDHPLWHRAETPDPFNPFQDYDEDVYASVDAAIAPQLTGKFSERRPDHPPSIGLNTKTTMGNPTANPGFFVGHDGLVWPLPPARPSPAYPPGLGHQPQRVPQALPPRDAFSGRDRRPYAFGPSPDSVSSSSSASEASLPTPPRLELKVSPNVGVIGDGRPRRGQDPTKPASTTASSTAEGQLQPRATPRWQAAAVRDPSPALSNALGIDFGWPAEASSRYVARTQRDSPPSETSTEPRFFRGRDGVVWPLPPSEDLFDASRDVHGGRFRRGRDPTPKW